MKTPILPLNRLLALICAAVTVQSTQAATSRAWTQTAPGSYNWLDTANWNAGNVPDLSADIASFGTAITAGTTTVNLASPLTIGGLTGGAGAAVVNLSITGSAITFSDDTAGETNVGFSYASGSSLNIANDVILSDPNGIAFNGTRQIFLNGVVSGSANVRASNANEVLLSNTGNSQSGIWTLNQTSAAFNFSSASAMGTAEYRIGGAANNSILRFSNSTDQTVNNLITDIGTAWNSTSSTGIQLTGGNTISFSNLGDFQSGTGRIVLGRSNASGTANYRVTDSDWSPGATIMMSSATLELANTSGVQTLSGNYSGGGLTRSGVGGVSKVSGVISGGIGTVTSGGTLVLSGANTNTGATTVSGGTLVINTAVVAGNSGTGTGNVNVNSGTFGGNGIVRPTGANRINVLNGAFVAPGDTTVASPIGTITLDGSGTTAALLTMNTGARFSFDLGTASGVSDKANLWNFATGDFVLNSTAINFTLDPLTAPGSYTFNLFNFYTDNGSTLSGATFSGLVLGDLSPNISSAVFDYSTAGQINLNISAVPEPNSALLTLLGGVICMLVVRRRHHSVERCL